MIFPLRSAPNLYISLQRQTRILQRHHLSTVSSTDTGAPASHLPSRFSRLSSFWLATGGITQTEGEDGHAKLIRAGYLRQSHAGIFHTLPLGERVQKKLESLIDKYMSQLGASKVSLSSISSQALWQQTNRLEGYGQELFRFTDRKEVPYILAPTHEEEITKLVAKTIKSYKTLPLRLYQIGRKYRDEIRPRHGVLRSREFVMKDLYTFDHSLQSALKTYEEACAAYSQLFDELKLPYLVAEASSGDIGGDLSHEYHLPSQIGEDNVISCTDCEYVANEELATARPTLPEDQSAIEGIDTPSSASAKVWRSISKDRQTLVNVWYPASFTNADINTHALKSLLPSLDSSLEDALPLWESALFPSNPSSSGQRPLLLNIIDYRLRETFANTLKADGDKFSLLPHQTCIDVSELDVQFVTSSASGEPLNTIRIRDGDHCPRCSSGKLMIQKAIELGHTFHLGTKYSDALDARVQVPSAMMEDTQTSSAKSDSMTSVPMQMGCHGIGVSRIIGAVADHLADERGLNWPRAIAPFEVVVIPGRNMEEDAITVARSLIDSSDTSPTIDLALDDRAESFPWKLKDADLIGYPVMIILGRKWTSDRLCEVQCRQLDSTEFVPLNELQQHVNGLLAQL
ncbi:class II aaRS and biotin synthetase [Xylaria bambusicola]|uniref:class II aaRS and biotin synthetase n=1 Tax=Xylaria bambusicola TaxID=326684 RepID=UPI0020088BA5|nr:class II aaRS and biotin synthetase [Xylaria bambusicola]KAI0525788.1 class II aaRS and biotin synthetase [Xylaria bambusicola]